MTEEHNRVQAAAQAAEVAKDVAQRAAAVAEEVVKKASETAEKVLLFSQTMSYIQADIKDIKEKLDNKYVTVESFSTVRNIVYGMVSLILVSFAGALITLVIR